MNPRMFLPEGLTRLLKYSERFRVLGLNPMWALSRRYRSDLESSLIELLPRNRLQGLKYVVDVGANVGNWSIGIARLTRTSQIIAFEPVPEVFKQLEQNTQDFPQIRCVNAAVGAKSGYVNMYFEQIHQLSSVLPMLPAARAIHGSEAATTQQISVPVVSLDDQLQHLDEVSVLKLDVQGYETEVLNGAQLVLKRTEVLVTEVLYTDSYEGNSRFETLLSLISSMSELKLWVVSEPKISKAGIPYWADAVFVRNRTDNPS